jgi:hypothetical protein
MTIDTTERRIHYKPFSVQLPDSLLPGQCSKVSRYFVFDQPHRTPTPFASKSPHGRHIIRYTNSYLTTNVTTETDDIANF